MSSPLESKCKVKGTGLEVQRRPLSEQKIKHIVSAYDRFIESEMNEVCKMYKITRDQMKEYWLSY